MFKEITIEYETNRKYRENLYELKGIMK